MNMQEHLLSRHMCDETVVVTDTCAYFYLWNLSGQLTGYQRYNPLGSKKEYGEAAKYFTYGTGVWGLHKLDPSNPILCVVEGVFDACRLHNLGFNAIAILCNNPNHLTKTWLNTLPYTTVAVCDGDFAGRKLARSTDYSIELKNGLDLGDLTNEELVAIGRQISKSTRGY